MLRMFKEFYEKCYSRACAERRFISKPKLSAEESEHCLEIAKKKVCEVGLSKYQLAKLLKNRYGRAIESQAVSDAIELGIVQRWLGWTPHRVNEETGEESKNAVLTEEGFEYIKSEEFRRSVSLVHTAYMLDSGRFIDEIRR